MSRKKYYGMSAYVKNAKDAGTIPLQEIVKALEFYMAKYNEWKKTFKAADRARVSQQWVDGLIAKSAAKHPDDHKKITCKKGCSFCCHQNVDVSFDEAALLLETAGEINWQEVEAQASDESLRVKRCVFLKDDACSVYAHRPLSCRKYFVVNEPTKCDLESNDNDGSVDVLGMRDPEFIASAIMNCVDYGPMATMLLKARKFTS